MKKFVVILLLAFLPSLASAQVRHPLFGIRLGIPLGVPECNDDEAAPEEAACSISGQGTLTEGGVTELPVRLPYRIKPDFFNGRNLTVSLVHGRVERISIVTSGYSAQEEAIAYLSAQYGRPATLKKSHVHTEFGSKYIKYTAQWNVPGGTAVFIGINGKINLGSIEITSDSYGVPVKPQQPAKNTAKRMF